MPHRTIRDLLITALQRTESIGRTRHDSADHPEWHAETLLARELGADWRHQLSGAGHVAEDDA